jgi:hypothetical protein
VAHPTYAPALPKQRPAQSLAAADPGALCTVEGFTLSRRGVGSLRWLVPVDVRGLELDRIANIEQGARAVGVGAGAEPAGPGGLAPGRGPFRRGEAPPLTVHANPPRTHPHPPTPGEVTVYTGVDKPPVGTELNTSCEITLLNVFKKKNGQVGAAGGAREGRLPSVHPNLREAAPAARARRSHPSIKASDPPPCALLPSQTPIGRDRRRVGGGV